MKIDLGRNVQHLNDFTEVEIPMLSESYYEVVNISGGGDFVNSTVKFNTEKVVLVIEIDGTEVINVDVELLKDYIDVNMGEDGLEIPLIYLKDKKIVRFSMGVPVSFKDTFVIKTKANSEDTGRMMEGYSIFLANRDS